MSVVSFYLVLYHSTFEIELKNVSKSFHINPNENLNILHHKCILYTKIKSAEGIKQHT